ncbi:MAG: membrane protein insertion efficiency factor YidD [Holosporales bacterium]|jgi:putative membrane protein insertion efficiency factor|nr:membrane protein insertion efficiency factor YidD [Holosporales bacterium]
MSIEVSCKRLSRLCVSYLINGVRMYQKVWGKRGCCRYVPCCSTYMILALQKWGFLKGLWKGVCRLLRCHPWGGFGVDFPEEIEKKKACL